MGKNKLRLRFCKTGNAKYISHLDLMATMQRGLLRAGVNLRYTEGFNPHPIMSIALPLSVGCESVCELMDIDPADPLPGNLNDFFPEGIAVTDSYISEQKFANIVWLGIRGSLMFGGDIAELRERFTQESIIIQKKTKRGVNDIDIIPFIRDVEFHEGDMVTMTAKISAQNPTLSSENLMQALDGDLKPDFTAFCREEVYDAEMNIFR
ncbi:MAG: TIGR03936 family radical SAM-associated protein [Oscillospiraceae bacterium]|nr:TIGR03936 family radical SAM-associated protein [Oscillospiraceae bacterium]